MNIESPWDIRPWLDERTDVYTWGPKLLNMLYTDEQRQQVFAAYSDLARELKHKPEITHALIMGEAGGHFASIIGNVIAILQRNADLDSDLAEQIIKGTWVAPQLGAGFALITQGKGIPKLEQFLLTTYKQIHPESESISPKSWLSAFAALNLLNNSTAKDFRKSSAFIQLTESDRDDCIRRTEKYYNIWKDVPPV